MILRYSEKSTQVEQSYFAIKRTFYYAVNDYVIEDEKMRRQNETHSSLTIITVFSDEQGKEMLSFLRRRRQSDESDISGFVEQPRAKSRKPPNTAFRQQRLKSWQPILSPKSVLPILFLAAIIFTPLGIALIYTTFNVQQFVVNYGECSSIANTSEFSAIPSKYYTKHFKSSVDDYEPSWKLVESDDDGQLTCQVKFDVPNDIKAPIFLYYRLTNFYQNHREYVESFDLDQLKGKAVSADDLDGDCGPLKKNSEGKAYYPCGLIANSYFNDTFSSPYNPDNSDEIFNMTDKKISWSSDRSKYKKTKYNPDDIVPPPNWSKKYPNGYTADNLPDLSEWESLQVWMRTAGLPNFMKLALRNDKDTLTKGEYVVDIGLNYPVSVFGGTKSMVLTTSTVIGGRNMSLGIAYLVVASLSVLFGVIFLIKYIIKPRKLGDHSYLNFEREEPEASTAAPTRTVREIL